MDSWTYRKARVLPRKLLCFPKPLTNKAVNIVTKANRAKAAKAAKAATIGQPWKFLGSILGERLVKMVINLELWRAIAQPPPSRDIIIRKCGSHAWRLLQVQRWSTYNRSIINSKVLTEAFKFHTVSWVIRMMSLDTTVNPLYVLESPSGCHVQRNSQHILRSLRMSQSGCHKSLARSTAGSQLKPTQRLGRRLLPKGIKVASSSVSLSVRPYLSPWNGSRTEKNILSTMNPWSSIMLMLRKAKGWSKIMITQRNMMETCEVLKPHRKPRKIALLKSSRTRWRRMPTRYRIGARSGSMTAIRRRGKSSWSTWIIWISLCACPYSTVKGYPLKTRWSPITSSYLHRLLQFLELQAADLALTAGPRREQD